jgi:hypothetical protein
LNRAALSIVDLLRSVLLLILALVSASEALRLVLIPAKNSSNVTRPSPSY